MAPPVPALPVSLGLLGRGSRSNVSLLRSGHLISSQEGDGFVSSDTLGTGGLSHSNEGGNIMALEREVLSIRRRRTEVTGHYEARLEYLRAKLRGAELHEKLLRK